MQQQQPGTATHSCISSLLISWRLTRPRVASRYSARTSSYFKQLTSYLPVSRDNNYVCYECVNVPEVGVATPKILECASCASGCLSKFLDPPLGPSAVTSFPACIDFRTISDIWHSLYAHMDSPDFHPISKIINLVSCSACNQRDYMYLVNWLLRAEPKSIQFEGVDITDALTLYL